MTVTLKISLLSTDNLIQVVYNPSEMGDPTSNGCVAWILKSIAKYKVKPIRPYLWQPFSRE